jgi:hypothetical protein
MVITAEAWYRIFGYAATRPMIQGSLATFAPQDLFDWLARRKLSGLLALERGDVSRRFQIAGGVLTRVASTHPAEHLSRVLVGCGYVTDDHVDATSRVGEPLGQSLVAQGMVAEDDLRSVLELKIREGLYECLSWTDGSFLFEPGTSTGKRGVQVAVPLRTALQEGEGRAALWRAVRERIPDDNCRFRVLLMAGTADELLQDAARGLTVREIMLERRSLPFPVYRALAELAERGVLAVAAPETSTPADLATAARAVLARYGVPRLTRDRDAILAEPLSPGERALVSRIDGRWDVMSLLRAAPFGEADALVGLARLASRGLVSLEEKP